MQQDLRSKRPADVVGVSMRHDEATNLLRGASKGRDGGMKPRKRTAQARVNQRDVVLEDREGRGAYQRYRKDPVGDLSRK